MGRGGSFGTGVPVVVAHRGASATHPENTMASFEAAVASGAEVVEFDVRVTADGSPVVMHDALVDRTTDGHGAVRSLSLDEVRRLRVRNSDDPSLGVPTLLEVLTAVSGRVGVDIEIKNIPGDPDFDADRERAVEATLEAVEAAAFVGPVLVSSFNPLSIARARELEPRITTGLLTTVGVEADVALGFADEHGHQWVLPFVAEVVAAGPGFAERVHRVGMFAGTWIVDDPDAAVALMRSGVDAVATNDPVALVAARDRAFG
ncbi:MAG TPA: glycerophosphodiester phosphodiesterase [Actinomycetota bacterium]